MVHATDQLLRVAEVVLATVRAQVDVDPAHAQRGYVTVQLGEARRGLGKVAVGAFSAYSELLPKEFDLDFVISL